MPKLTVDTARCAADTVDGETLVIDTISGHLRVLTGIAPVLWARLAAPTDVAELVAEVAERYGAEAGEAAAAFVAELEAAQLVVSADDGIPLDSGAAPSATSWPDAYEPPAVEAYDDIAEIMAMDPVHEVDVARGWPHRDPA